MAWLTKICGAASGYCVVSVPVRPGRGFPPAVFRRFPVALPVIGRADAIDRGGANTAGITAVNRMPKSFGCPIPTEMARPIMDMLVKDGKVASMNVEAPGKFEVSDAGTLLAQARG